VAAAVAHPDLRGDGAAQLTLIAQCAAWRAIHWALLFGFALALTGLVGLVGMHVGTPGESAARAGVLVGIFAYAVWAVLVAFMVGAGGTLALSYIAAEPGLAATHAVFLYDMLHPFALAAQRTAAFALGISTFLFGWAVINGKVLPRRLGAAAVARGLGAVGVALGFPGGGKADEAGVWVIAETTDLPTKFVRIVVTDDQGRYVIPDLPKASYRVWARGYGLVDSPQAQAVPGAMLNLSAVVAPNPRAAAEYYPAGYWFSLMRVPAKGEFASTGADGNGMAPNVKSQAEWIRILKSGGCWACHQLGSKGTREIPKALG